MPREEPLCKRFFKKPTSTGKSRKLLHYEPSVSFILYVLSETSKNLEEKNPLGKIFINYYLQLGARTRDDVYIVRKTRQRNVTSRHSESRILLLKQRLIKLFLKITRSENVTRL